MGRSRDTHLESLWPAAHNHFRKGVAALGRCGMRLPRDLFADPADSAGIQGLALVGTVIQSSR